MPGTENSWRQCSRRVVLRATVLTADAALRVVVLISATKIMHKFQFLVFVFLNIPLLENNFKLVLVIEIVILHLKKV